jgi:non-ribosomal peptide synthetase component F
VPSLSQGALTFLLCQLNPPASSHLLCAAPAPPRPPSPLANQAGPQPQLQYQPLTSSYVRGSTKVPLLGETIGQNLERTAAKWPDQDALVSMHQGIRLTYRQFLGHVNEVARGLLALGVQKRDRVGVWAPNCAEWTVMQYATAKVGCPTAAVLPTASVGPWGCLGVGRAGWLGNRLPVFYAVL